MQIYIHYSNVEFHSVFMKGPAKVNIEESVSTLRFASTTKHIKNKAVINEDAKDALLRRFQQQIDELRHQLELEAEENEANGDSLIIRSNA